MVFIHGGSFNSGSGDSLVYGPKYLLQHDVIVVTINYRLEVLGFLSLNIPEVPGNAGMKDQVAALKWVQNNIAKFGGDPDNVTIFGESAGSASVTYHMISPMSKGLFQKVIAQSGSCIHDWALGRCAKERAFRIGKVLGKDTENIDELLQYLRSVSASDLIGMTYKTRTDDETHLDIPIFFAPVVEKRFEGVVPFLEEEPIDILVKGQTSAVPLMIGYNSGEGILTASDEIISDKNNDTKYLVPREIARKISENKAREMGERIKQYYIGNQIFSNDTINEYVEMATDTNVMYNMIRYANYHTATKEPVFIYRFDYDTDLNVVKKMLRRGYIKGASHADDLFYLFNSLVTDGVYRKQEKLKEIMYNVTKMWTDFAKTGNPTPDNRLGVTWEPLKTVNEYEFMLLEDPLSVGPIPEYDRLHFWNNLYCEAGAPCIESLK
ncbi:carboxylic ester hydrolase [Amyelois transitella]|uniref:carboxylic ester hydrolase n=1 Tax=Amyelois transitella TaxID=680683 RepID=UPI0029905DA1|nr:carboxylic ester hydrolase [Amyelois transitella]